MKLFTLGPVEMDPQTLAVGAEPLPYFRTMEFSERMYRLGERLRILCGANPKGSRIAMLTGSGTAAMEAAVSGILGEQDRVLIINGGTFGARFEALCQHHGIAYSAIRLSFGEELTERHLEDAADTRHTALLVNVHETGTGQYYPIEMLSRHCQRHGLLLIVDAISSLVADPFDMEGWGVDVALFSSHKGLAAAPGMAFVVIEEKTYRERVAGRVGPIFYLDLENHILDQERGQSPFTPAISVALQVEEKLERIEAHGVLAYVARCARLAEGFRSGVRTMTRFELPTYPLSNAQTPLLCPEGDAQSVFEKLRSRGFLVNPSGGYRANDLLRVGHIGALDEADHEDLLRVLTEL